MSILSIFFLSKVNNAEFWQKNNPRRGFSRSYSFAFFIPHHTQVYLFKKLRKISYPQENKKDKESGDGQNRTAV